MLRPLKLSSDIKFVGGALCLDFTNTVNRRRGPQPEELLVDYPSLVGWSQAADLLTPDDAQRLVQHSRQHRRQAAAVWEQALTIREVIYRVLTAIIQELAIPESDMDGLNHALSEALQQSCLVRSEPGLSWGWKPNELALDRMVWPIVRSAADLLTASELPRVRQCGALPCGWLFLDRTKNHSRNWCQMQVCGNRAKSRRHYARRKRQQP